MLVGASHAGINGHALADEAVGDPFSGNLGLNGILVTVEPATSVSAGGAKN